jgi:channel protein (hemolysin III family)
MNCAHCPAPGGVFPELYRLPGCYEPFSALSHLLGAVAFLILGWRLLRCARGRRDRLILLGVYASSCVLLFLMSGLYHLMERGNLPRLVLERLDHAAIFILIAGTFTPIHGLLFRGWLRWGPLLVIWGAALAGIVLKTFYFEAISEWVGLLFYLSLGWCGAVTVVLLGWQHGFSAVRLLLLGGVAYSTGAVLDFLRYGVWIPHVIHSHELFHLTILLGALLHWMFIWRMVTEEPEPVKTPERLPAVLEPAPLPLASSA